MKKRILSGILLMAALMIMLPISIRADVVIEPSVTVIDTDVPILLIGAIIVIVAAVTATILLILIKNKKKRM